MARDQQRDQPRVTTTRRAVEPRSASEERLRVELAAEETGRFGVALRGGLLFVCPDDARHTTTAEAFGNAVLSTYVVLDQLLTVAVERGIIAASPAKGVQLPRIVRMEAHFLTPSELERLASAIQPRYRAMVLVMAWGTLRMARRADYGAAT